MMSFDKITEKINQLSEKARELVQNLGELEHHTQIAQHTAEAAAQGYSPFVIGLTVFVLAVFVGYYVVWRVTPALHSPLMAVTNAVSSVIIVGALLATGLQGAGLAKIMGFLAVILASVNIFGGFIVTRRMLQMFSKKS
jgi:NAD(P) transhydrogenase subunit alpha